MILVVCKIYIKKERIKMHTKKHAIADGEESS